MVWTSKAALGIAVGLFGVLAAFVRGTRGAPPSAIVPRDVNHVLGTGQSLSVGIGGTPPRTLRQPFGNLMLEPGVMSGGTASRRFVPLMEGDVIPGYTVPVETMSSAFANLVTQQRRPGELPHPLLVSVHGVSGTPYTGLKKGTAAYETGMAQVVAARDLARAIGKTYVVRAVTNVHGESEHLTNNVDYDANLLAWQRDYEDDVRALTGQREPVPMFITQISTWTMYANETSVIPGAQLAAHVAAPGKVVLVGPKYHLPYTPDGVHLTTEGYQHLGEDHAKAYRRVVLENAIWEPVRPRRITRAGAVITARFHVPVPPLAIDTKLVTDPGSFGFAYVDESASPPPITRVAVTAPDIVTITLASIPTGASGRLRYAFTGAVAANGGPRTGPRGNLRDSDRTPSRSGVRLYNWCIHFEEAIRDASRGR